MPEGKSARLLGQIYDASFDAGLWVQVMEGLASELAGSIACMTTLDIHTGLGTGATALAPDGTMDKYLSWWTQDNPLHQIQDPLDYIQAWEPSVIRYEDWVERSTLHNSGFFNDFLEPLGAGNGIMIGLALIGTSTITMNIARPLRKGMFSSTELALARRWQPHLSRAVRLGQAVQVSQVALDAVDQLVAVTPHCLFFLDQRGRVRRLSRPAEAMLEAGPELYAVNGILSASQPDEETEFRRLIARAVSRSSETAASGGTMRLRRRDGHSYEVEVAPLGPRSSANWSSEPMIMVAVRDGRGPHMPIELRLRSRFGFTPAEARVAVALMRGGTLRETAAAVGVSVNTARVHLAAIFKKTGCHRQTELMRALLMVEQDGRSIMAELSPAVMR